MSFPFGEIPRRHSLVTLFSIFYIPHNYVIPQAVSHAIPRFILTAANKAKKSIFKSSMSGVIMGLGQDFECCLSK